MKTMKPGQLDERLRVARQIPGIAHLPHFGLMAPAGWDFHCPELERRALEILDSEGIKGTITQTAPALFWYHDTDDELQLHDWTEITNVPSPNAE